jgi:hypothetical protein
MDEKFETWAIVELFGHNKIAGKVSEQVIAGQGYIRVDVPELEGSPAFTKMFGTGAIYSITPVDEEIARQVARYLRIEPVHIYSLPEIIQEDNYQSSGDGSDVPF